MKKIINCAGLLMIVAGLISCGNNTESDPKETADSTNHAKIDSAKSADTVATTNSPMADMKQDADFAVAAADGGMLEVELGKMAVKKGMNKQIKNLGAMMVKDHSKANEELKSAAKALNITLPSSMSDKCEKKVADLSAKTGADFDKAYSDLMVSDHKDDIDEFKKEADKGKNSVLTAWAKSKLPVLEHHLAISESAKKAVEKN